MVMASLHSGSTSRRRKRLGQCQPALNLLLQAECEYYLKWKRKRESMWSACSSSSSSPKSRSASAPRLLPLLLLVLLSNIMWLPTTTAQYANCFSFLKQADADSNRILSRAEFAGLMRLITSGAIADDPDFSALPVALSDLFVVPFGDTSGGVDVSGIDDASAAAAEMESFCFSIYPVLADALGVTTTQRQCFVAMTIGDTDRDNFLVSESEFVRFASQMSGGVYGISIPFDDLPNPVNAIYEDFSSKSGGESIDVTGSKPGTTPTDTELPFLQNLCFQLSIAIIAGEQEPLVEPTPSGPVPTPTPAVVVVESPTVSFSVCRNGLIVSDLNRNDFLDEEEYVRFVNRLANNEWITETYDTVPAVLQENFVQLVDSTGQIPVIGSKPGQTATANQQDHLNKLCFDTDDAIDVALNPPTGGVPTPAPTAPVPVATAAPTTPPLDFTACKLNMVVADINRDDEMNDEEYVRFLNRFTQNMFLGFEYADLEPVLQENFIALAVNDFINLAGSKPGQSPSPAEETFLTRVCVDTLRAIEMFLQPSPTSAPTPLEIETQTVYNSFVVSNTVGLRASSLISGRERRGLDDGWVTFAQEVFTDGMPTDDNATETSRRSLRGTPTRRLDLLGVTNLSAVVYQIDDLDCPEFVTTDDNTFCQEAFASFSFDYVNEADPESFVASLFNRSVNAINAGDLQDQLELAFALTNLLVGKTTATVRPPDILTPTASPGANDPTRRPTRIQPKGDDDEGGGSSIGIIIGGLLGITVVLAGGGYWYYRRRKNGGGGGGGGGGGSWCGCLSGLSMPKKQSKKESTLEGDGSQNPADKDGDEEEDGDAFGQFEKKPQKGGLGGMFGGSGDDDEKDDERDDEHNSNGGFSVQEQSPGKTKNEEEKTSGNVFGFGLGGKQKKNSENNLGADFDIDQDGGAADFADYGFDEPDDAKLALPQSADNFFGGDQNDADGPSWGDQGQNQAGGAWGGSNAFQQDENQDTFFGESDGSGSPHDDEDGMFGDEDSGSESNSYDDDEDNNDDTKSASRSGSVVPDNMRQLDALVEKGDWDGVMAAAAKFETDLDTDELSNHSGPSVESQGNDESDSRSSGDGDLFKTTVFGDKEDAFDDATATSSVMTMTSEEVRRRSQYREQVVALVRKTVPDEIDNVDAMLDQFMGREAELINTLQTMYERSSTQRARKAVHKSKGVPQRDSRGFSPGGAEGSAAIAAASTIGVQHAFDGPKQPQNFGGDGFGDDGEDDEGSGTGSYDDEESGTGSFDDEEPDKAYDDEFGAEGSYGDDIDDIDDAESGAGSGSGSGSFDDGDPEGTDGDDIDDAESGSGSGSGSFDDGGPEGTYDDDFNDGEGSYVSGEGSYMSREGSYQSGEGSHVSDEGSYVSGEGSYQSGEGSHVSGEGSYVSGEGSYQSGEGSHVSGEGSYVSEEGSYQSGEGSYHSGEGSYQSGEGSYVSGEGSYHSGEGSFQSGEGSYVSGEGSYHSGEGSFQSGEGSYQSGEGSYVSGEGSKQSGEGSYQSGSGSYDDEDEFQD